MMKAVLALFLLLSLPVVAADSGYTISIHVSETRVVDICGGATKGNSNCGPVERLSVSINGSKYELESDTFLPKGGIIALGDYKAKVVSDKTKPDGEFNRTYELQFRDGTTRKFQVVGEME